jgi:hypothetical protein
VGEIALDYTYEHALMTRVRLSGDILKWDGEVQFLTGLLAIGLKEKGGLLL